MPCASSRARWSLAAALLSLAVCAPAALAQAPPPKPPRKPPRQPLPLDPLTAEELKIAERVAREEPRVTEAIGPGRYKLIYVEFLALKPEDPKQTVEAPGVPIQIGRHAEVLFYRYDGDVGIRAVVDLVQQAVRDVTRVDGQAVPVTEEEVTEAGELALHDSTVFQRLGEARREYKIEGMRILATRENDPCYRHRCVDLLFRRGAQYLVAFPVTVDLTSRDVRVGKGDE
jgi:Cu2+-containing amine oxidase